MRAAWPQLFCSSFAAAVMGNAQLAAQDGPPATLPLDRLNNSSYTAVQSPPAPAAKGTSLALPSINLPPTNSSWQIGPPLATDPEWMPKLAAPTEYVGWFGGIEASYLKPKIFSVPTTPASFYASQISQPVGKLDWTGAPKVSVGYRFGDGCGELLVAYRLLGSSGSSTLPAFEEANFYPIRSRVNVNTLDIDYVCPEYLNEGRDISPAYFRELKFGFGVRAASLYFDTQGGTPRLVEQHITSEFSGVGPRTFAELHRDIGTAGWEAYSRIDASGVVGPIKQRFFRGSGFGITPGYDTGNHNTGVGIGSVEVGIGYVPPAFDGRLRLTAAYTYEEWWAIKTDDSKAKLSLQGAVLRAELRY